MQTPIQTPGDERDRRYNAAHSHARCISERVNGIIKGQFRLIGAKLRHKPQRCATHIITTLCLYNLKRIDIQRQLMDPGMRREMPGRQGLTARQYRRLVADDIFNHE